MNVALQRRFYASHGPHFARLPPSRSPTDHVLLCARLDECSCSGDGGVRSRASPHSSTSEDPPAAFLCNVPQDAPRRDMTKVRVRSPRDKLPSFLFFPMVSFVLRLCDRAVFIFSPVLVHAFSPSHAPPSRLPPNSLHRISRALSLPVSSRTHLKLKLNVLTWPTTRRRSFSKRAHSLRFGAEHQRLDGSQRAIFERTYVSVRGSHARTPR